MAVVANGALVGWKRTPGEHGIVLTLQLVGSAEDFHRQAFEVVQFAVNDRQLRSLARDLTRAAKDQGIELFAPRRWWQVWRPRDE